MSFRCAFAIDDDLHHFAAMWLALPPPPMPTEWVHMDGAAVACLHTAAPFQVELCRVPSGYVIPDHVHPHADTIEVGVEGAVRLAVNGIDAFKRIPDSMMPRVVRGRGIRINATDMHGGRAVARQTAFFYSIQRWIGDPQSVLSDYKGQPLGPRHKEALA
jgi:hypothetical protein